MLVAIASENDDYDGTVYERLLVRCLEKPIQRWPTDMRFTGHRSITKRISLFLQRAAAEGVRHALIARDNDGTATKGPEHEPTHDPAAQTANPHGCRVCELIQTVPAAWVNTGGIHCLAVPVQMLETWLLVARGDTLVPTPEQCFSYSRGDIKKAFWGRGKDALTSREAKMQRALEVLDAADALPRLRTLKSFCYFEAQLSGWG